jgi:hypothetical protein
VDDRSRGNDCGIRRNRATGGGEARLRTPEWATLSSDVQKGKTPFYYMGRGSVVDPSRALSQYFEPGGSPRFRARGR